MWRVRANERHPAPLANFRASKSAKRFAEQRGSGLVNERILGLTDGVEPPRMRLAIPYSS
jgi:hypothetical protein